MVNLTDILRRQKTIEQEIKKYQRLKEQRFELLQLRRELHIQPDAEDLKFIESLNESISNIEKRMADVRRNISVQQQNNEK
ncbi:hypothetical protein [Aneurinibacillus sp. REN35]|uniref:hypothetical protein n=1 Tax=Aneurinibacillus sp. REN35 TaxID=3237286 RepID=UPI0035273821